jgi:hypothetical protein
MRHVFLILVLLACLDEIDGLNFHFLGMTGAIPTRPRSQGNTCKIEPTSEELIVEKGAAILDSHPDQIFFDTIWAMYVPMFCYSHIFFIPDNLTLRPSCNKSCCNSVV